MTKADAASARPKRGLPPEAALERWSDPILYAEMKEFSDASEARSIATGHPPTPYMLRHREYSKRRQQLEADFLELLQAGSALASAIAKWQTRREIIDPSLWDILEIDYDLDDIVGEGRTYTMPEFFDPSLPPLNVHMPEWLGAETPSPPLPPFQADPSYRHVTLNGVQFTLGPVQANVVKHLHQAAERNDPWQSGKRLLEQAGSSQTKMHDVFKSQADWQHALIESDRRGNYRLRLG